MKPNPVGAAVKSALSTIEPSAPTNTHVELGSQSDAPRKKDDGGPMPDSNTFVSDRSKSLNEIFERRNAQAAAELEESLPVTDGDGEEVETTAPKADPLEAGKDLEGGDTEEQSAALETKTVTAEPAKSEEMRTIVVDGKSMEVPVSKIIERGTATLQKESAADARLERANQILAEAQLVAAKGQPSKDVDQAAAITELNDDQLAELIQFGTKEQAAQAIKILRSPQPQVKPEDVVRQAVNAVPLAMAFEEGKKFVVKEYMDLLQDPDLGAIFLQRENVARAKGDTRTPIELYTAIGEDLRTKFNRPKPGAALKPTPPAANASTKPERTMAEKREAKANSPQLPRLASARLDGDANAPKAPTRAETFASMRRARGFTQGKDL